jgi:chromosome segregation ATPase
MAMSRGFWYRWITVILVAAALAYAGTSFKRQDAMKSQLNDLLQQTIEEKDQLQTTITSMEEQLRDKEARLNSLQDVQSIRNALAASQASVENINKEFERATRERASLQDANLNMSTRLQNTTREYMRTIEELTKAKADIARISKEMNPDKKKLDESARIAQAKTEELAAVKTELAGQQKVSEQLVATNKALEKRLKNLESEKAALGDKMQQMDIDLSKQGSPINAMRDTIEQLKNQLSRKENQIASLESELTKADTAAAARARSGKPDLSAQTAAQDAQLRQQLNGLIDQLNEARLEMAKMRQTKDQSPSSGETDRKLSDILVKKEIELESTRREALDAKDKIMSLQSKISNLENTIATRKQTENRIQELDSERLALESKLADAQASLNKKTELSQNLQQNIDYLNQQLTGRDREKKDLEARLAGIDSNTKQDLEKERARYTEINTLYNSLKTQISQFSDTLNAKTTELEQRNKDIYALREELTSLKSKAMITANELTETKDRQRKTLDDLIAAVRLNSILQERIAGGASVPYANMDDKQKAEELRRKVEVILVPPDKQ